MPDLNPLGGEVRVNPNPDGSQLGATIIALAGGAYVVLWCDVLVSNEDSTWTLKGRVFSPLGAPVGELSLGAIEDPTQSAAFGSAALSDGGFAIIYAPLGASQVRVQRYDDAGAAVGAPITLPGGVPLDTPSLSARSDGGFYAVYDALGDTDPRLVAARYGSGGAAVGTQFDIAQDYAQPAATVLANGDLLVAWEEDNLAQSGSNIRARIFSPQGAARGSEILVDVDAVRARTNAAVTAFDDGRFAVTWWDRTDDNVFVRLFAASGAPLGAPVAVDPAFAGAESSAQVIATAGGGFVVTYTADGKDGDGPGLFARRFGADGQPLNAPVQIAATSAGLQSSGVSNVAVLADGTLAFTWFGNGEQPGQVDDLGIFVRRYDLSSDPGVPTAGDDLLVGTSDNDRYLLQQGGNDQVSGGAGSDGFYFGAAYTAGDSVDGGIDTDTLALQGNYPALTLGPISNVEVLALIPGSDTRFGDTAGNSYDYAITTIDANVASGARLTVVGGNLMPGEDLVFDGSAELDGHFRIFAGRGLNDLTGGAGSDGFYFGADGNWTATSRVDGGPGVDTIAFRGNYVDATAINMVDASFTNIEVLAFLSGHTNEYGGFIDTNGFYYDVTLADGNIAAGQRLDVIATTLRDNESLWFDGRAETDGSVRVLGGAGEDILRTGAGADILAGGIGFDVMDGGAGADTYLFTSVEDAPRDSVLADKVDLRTGDGDRIDLSMIDAIAGTSANDAFTFIGEAEFSNVAGQLRAYRASPSIANSWTIFADIDGDGEADLWISALSDAPITASDFVL